jgi:hypothetical protein
VFWTAGRGWGLRTLVPIKEVKKNTNQINFNFLYIKNKM